MYRGGPSGMLWLFKKRTGCVLERRGREWIVLAEEENRTCKLSMLMWQGIFYSMTRGFPSFDFLPLNIGISNVLFTFHHV